MLSIKILVITGDKQSAKLFEEILAPFYHLKIVPTGEEALTTATRFLPDIILLDRELPGMSGDAVGKQISEDADLQPVKIVMISQQTSQEDIREGFFSGADYYLTKPLDREQLLALIERIINARVSDPVRNRYF